MNVVDRWGRLILILQLVFGVIGYLLMTYHGINEDVAIKFAFTLSGVVAAMFVIVAIILSRPVGIAVATSALAVVLAALSMLTGSSIFTGLFGFIAVAQGMLAGMLARAER